jgi:cytidylate kinase
LSSSTRLRELSRAVAITGPIASGKSTVGRRLSDDLSWPLISFGAYIRNEARRRNDTLDDRAELERIGAELISSRGYEQFMWDVIESQCADEHVILDGIRHTELLQALNRACPQVSSFYLDAPLQIRYQRWLHREGIEDGANARVAFEDMAHDQVECHVYSLAAEVDYVIDATQSTPEIIIGIRSHIL